MVGKCVTTCVLLFLTWGSVADGMHTFGGPGTHQALIEAAGDLKNEVHRSDGDGGDKFQKWLNKEAINYFLTGAHDEDSTKTLGRYWGSESPIGPNGDGNFYQHYYDPETGKGWMGNDSAFNRANGYESAYLRAILCTPGGISTLPQKDQNQIYDWIGRNLHLLQDMANPSHTNNEGHPEAPFEDYVRDNWKDIASSKEFREKINVGQYEKAYCTKMNRASIAAYIHELARVSKSYSTEGRLYSLKNSEFSLLYEEELMRNINDLVPEAIMHSACYIDALYDFINTPDPTDPICQSPPEPSTPANDHPDDRYDVSDTFYWEKEFGIGEEVLTNLSIRTALRKGKVGVWYKKLFMETFAQGMEKYAGASPEEMAAIRTQLKSMEKKLKEREALLESEWKGAPDVALFTNGFYNPAISLMLKIGEIVSFQKMDFSPEIVKDHPVLLVPTGGFYGLEKSSAIKTILEEYVRNGGTLVALTQQHGSDWALLPTEADSETGERKPVTGFGYQEDQSCTFASVYVDTYHPILSLFSAATPNVGVDGYFISYPANATVLLRRTANGQPAMILYPYGKGYVIATTLYTDFALAHHQSNEEEIRLVGNIISWAKKPARIPEIKPGETISLDVELTNYTDADAAVIKFIVLDPDRKVLMERTRSVAVPRGQSGTVPVEVTLPPSSVMGIYHIDYALVDAAGNMVQPQAETDSGRFAVSNPSGQTFIKPLTYSITAPTEYYMYGDSATFTWHIWNNSEKERTVTIRYGFPHHTWETRDPSYGDIMSLSRKLKVAPKSEGTFTHTITIKTEDMLWSNLYDENDIYMGTSRFKIWKRDASARIEIGLDKKFYGQGETVIVRTTLKNQIANSWPAEVKMIITSPQNVTVLEELQNVSLLPYGASSAAASFTIPPALPTGTYTVRAESWYGGKVAGAATSDFEVPESQISIRPLLPENLKEGHNVIRFELANTGKIPISFGILEITLKDPEGASIFGGHHPFSLGVGKNAGIEIPMVIPSLRLGTYSLLYRQSDETKGGLPTTLPLPNQVAMALTLNKASYQIRESLSLTVNLQNSGILFLENMSLALAAMGLSETRNLSLRAGEKSPIIFSLPIPDWMPAGRHEIEATLSLSSGATLKRSALLVIPDAELKISYPDSSCRAGDALRLHVSNTGGVDSDGATLIRLDDRFQLKVGEESGRYSVTAGGSADISFTIPRDAVSGEYLLRVELRDQPSGQFFTMSKNVDVAGVVASVEVQTDKKIYLRSEVKEAMAQITPAAASSVEANLHLKAFWVKPWLVPGNFPNESVTDIEIEENMRNLSSKVEISNSYIDVVVDEKGQFTFGTTGGDPQNVEDDWAKLLYGHPNPGTSFTTVRIDGMDYVLGESMRPAMFPYLSDGSILTEWQIGNIRIVQRHSIVYSDTGDPDLVQIEYRVSNEDVRPHSVGLRVMLDTQLGYNDGAPFQIPEVGNVTEEMEFSGNAIPAWLSMNDLSHPTVVGKGILIGLGAVPPDRFVIARWPSIYGTDWNYSVIPGAPITGDSAVGIWWDPQTLAAGQERSVATFYGVGSAQAEYTIWEAEIPCALNAPVQKAATMDIPPEISGKLTLSGTLFSSSGQVLSRSAHTFYVIPANLALLLQTNKKFYRPGDTVIISGEIRNLMTVEAANLILEVKSQGLDGLVKILYSAPAHVSPGGIYPFTLTTTAEAEQPISLSGKVIQNGSVLVEVTDQYEVARPLLSTSLSGPYAAGADPFEITLEIKNRGKVQATTDLQTSIDPRVERLVIPPGETRMIRYIRQITEDADYQFIFSGDWRETLQRRVYFGLGASIALSPLPLSPEGVVAVPVGIVNTGVLPQTLEVTFNLMPGSEQRIHSYHLQPSESTASILYFPLTEGDYQITASSQVPVASAQASFAVRKENKVEMAVSAGTQAGGLIPVTVNLSNLGCNEVSGIVRVSVQGAGGTVWTAEEAAPPFSPQGGQVLTFNIDPSAIPPGNYNLRIELLNHGGLPLTVHSMPFAVSGPLFQVTQVPGDQTFEPGQEVRMIFKVKNTGNQDGAVDFHFKSYDLIDLDKREWLKAGDEKELPFIFALPGDLEEKDYFADYELKGPGGSRGQVKYRLAGIKLQVAASLDRQEYRDGETARLTLLVSSTASGAQALFVRVKYGPFEVQEPFMLSGTQRLPFDIPLPRITGEKLFFGIYHESGRSLHLNSLYIHSAGEMVTITTDKQVYKPGEAVLFTVASSLPGTLLLNGPGYEETLASSGAVSRSFFLPLSMAAGTYSISCKLSLADGQSFSGSRAFDVEGIQVKVKKASLDKERYAAADTINLALTVESNKDLAALLKAWVVDPEKNHTPAGIWDISLSKAAPLLTAQSFPFATTRLGVHRVIYALYGGDLLLCSGARVFDMGEASALGLKLDRLDYPLGNEPVTAEVSLVGSGAGTLEVFLDGEPAGMQPVSLSGFTTVRSALPAITPGRHNIKIQFTMGGLVSTKETSFIYGSALPDLAVRITAGATVQGGAMNVTITVANQGKGASQAAALQLYDGPLAHRVLLATLDVKSLEAGESQSFTYSLNVLGRAGENSLSVSVDGTGAVYEFNEENNSAQVSFSVPPLVLATSLEKRVYVPWEPVIAMGVITNLTREIQAGLTLATEVKDQSGAVVFSRVLEVPSLEGMRSVTLTLPLSTNLKEGDYTVHQALDGRASAMARFAVQDPFRNLRGEVLAQPNPVYQGKEETFTYRLRNEGKENLRGLTLKVLVVVPTTQVVKKSFEERVDAAANTTLSGSFAASTKDLPPGIYDLLLLISSAETPLPKTLAQASLEVKPGLEVSQGVAEVEHLLVWLNYPWEEKESCPDRGLLEQALQKAVAAYHIVLNEEEFAAALGNPSYTDFMILGDHRPLRDPAGEELRKRVYAGKGLIASLFSRPALEKELLGLRRLEELPGRDYQVEMPASEISPSGVFQSHGRAVKVEAANPAEVAGWIMEARNKYPGIIRRSYGEGRVLFFAFDLGLDSSEPLFGNALPYIHQPFDPAALPWGRLIPVEFRAKSLGAAFDLRLTVTFPPGLRLFDPAVGEWVEDNWVKDFSLGQEETRSVLFHFLPEEPGTHRLLVEAGILDGGSYQSYETLALELPVLPALRLTKSGPSYAVAGKPVQYRFSISHNAEGAVSGIMIRDPLLGPDGRFEVGEVSAGEARSFVVDSPISAGSSGLLVNTAYASGRYGEGELKDSSSWAIPVYPEESRVYPAADTFVSARPFLVWDGRERKEERYVNFGANEGLSVIAGRMGTGWRGTLIRFDLSSLPSEAEVAGAELFLNHYSIWDGDVSIHAMTRQWQEIGATWHAPCLGCDPWWQGWGGGNYRPEATDRRRITGQGWVSWDVTEDVRRFLKGTPHEGWFLKSASPQPNDTASLSFYSKEALQKNFRPYLKVRLQ